MSISRYPTKSPYFVTDTHVLEDQKFSLLPSPFTPLFFASNFQINGVSVLILEFCCFTSPKANKYW